MQKQKGKPDRIDFTLLNTGEIRIMKLRRDKTTNPRYPRDIPLLDGVSSKPPGFDLDAALNWCRTNGYTVRRWRNGARAWLGGAWVIRTRHQIKKMRERAERARRDYSIDFAYDG